MTEHVEITRQGIIHGLAMIADAVLDNDPALAVALCSQLSVELGVDFAMAEKLEGEPNEH